MQGPTNFSSPENVDIYSFEALATTITQVQARLEALQQLPEESFYASIGSLVRRAAAVLSETSGTPYPEASEENLVRLGTDALDMVMERVREPICPQKETIKNILTTGNVLSLVGFLLPLLPQTYPVAFVIFIAVVIFKRGIDAWCKEEKASQ
jgi:hypothetical protein